MPKPKVLRLILGDQLDELHSWFKTPDNSVTYVMMEIRQETDYVKHHIQKVAAFFAAMRTFSARLSELGHKVIYLRLDDRKNLQTIPDNLQQLLTARKYDRVEYLLPDEYRLDDLLRNLAKKLKVDVAAVDTEHFLTERHELKDFFAGKKRYLMESFYRSMRKRYDILMEKDKPLGGQWNYDQKNRQAYDGQVPIPKPLVFKNDVSDIYRSIQNMQVKTFGEIEPARLIWPTTRAELLCPPPRISFNLLGEGAFSYNWRLILTGTTRSSVPCKIRTGISRRFILPIESKR